MRWIIIILLTTVKICPNHDNRPQFHNGMVTVAASNRYGSPSLFEKIIFGSNYRKEWETPVTMPVFDMKKTNFKIEEMGGGRETTSLNLVDEQNGEWALRSVDKNVQPPRKFMENTFMEDIIQDHVSGSYPYAGLSVPDIAQAAGVPAGEEYLYFVPDDSAFGRYRSIMANKVFILVDKQKRNEEYFTTAEMQAKLDSGKIYSVDQKAYLRARLLDWLVADWDRHPNQWRWVERKADTGIVFVVIPKDHDQAFYKSNGLLVKFISIFFMPQLDKFNNNCTGISGLSKRARQLDQRLTDRLAKEDWENIIREFQKNVTDSVIETAIKKQPKEIFAIRGNELIGKLKSRRDGLLRHAMEYYSSLH